MASRRESFRTASRARRVLSVCGRRQSAARGSRQGGGGGCLEERRAPVSRDECETTKTHSVRSQTANTVKRTANGEAKRETRDSKGGARASGLPTGVSPPNPVTLICETRKATPRNDIALHHCDDTRCDATSYNEYTVHDIPNRGRRRHRNTSAAPRGDAAARAERRVEQHHTLPTDDVTSSESSAHAHASCVAIPTSIRRCDTRAPVDVV